MSLSGTPSPATLMVFQILSQGTTTQYPLHECRNQLGPTPVKVFLSKSHSNGTEQILGTMLNSIPPGSHLPPDHVLQHLEVIRDLPWSGPPLIYTDDSFTPTGGPLAGFCCPTETLHRGGGGIVLMERPLLPRTGPMTLLSAYTWRTRTTTSTPTRYSLTNWVASSSSH